VQITVLIVLEKSLGLEMFQILFPAVLVMHEVSEQQSLDLKVDLHSVVLAKINLERDKGFLLCFFLEIEI